MLDPCAALAFTGTSRAWFLAQVQQPVLSNTTHEHSRRGMLVVYSFAVGDNMRVRSHYLLWSHTTAPGTCVGLHAVGDKLTKPEGMW
jgi:hypothetical protein